MKSAVCCIVFAFLGSSYAFLLGGPAHASCKVDWTFGTSCDDVKTKIKAQIAAWTSADGCASGGEKCLYTFKSDNSNTLTATHTTPVHHYVDDLTFTFTPTDASSCKVHGYSTSETWYAHLDSSTNYCNLRNLITGSALHQVSGFAETTSDKICTQFSSANCEKY
ncbi:uncharacterized protein LOC125666773 [Ostrea edulis]|uniref:uncharacterized protein LOC125666773 n=1 Tax=Ostrea edulis TaxID=37623 RepID=UPI002094FB26|nr:uncharacterized protein LOC125666773 [Ostrea edulis]